MEAEAHFGTAITLNPRAYWVFQGYARAKVYNNEISEAEHLLKEADKIRPNHTRTLFEFGRIRQKQGLEAEAEDYFHRAITADENNVSAYVAMAKLLLRQQKYEEGLDYALAAASANPRDYSNRELVKEFRQRIEKAKSENASER